MSNLEFVHLVELKLPVPVSQLTLPSDEALKTDLLRWTFLQSAYLLPIMLFAGSMLILQLVFLVGRLNSHMLADGLSLALVLTVDIVGLRTLLNAFVGTIVVGVILTRIASALVVCSALGLVAQAVEILPAAGFSTVMFGTVYGLGTAFASCSTFAGYQLASALKRHSVSFKGIGIGETEGYRGLFLVEGVFILALCPVICILLLLSRRVRRKQSIPASLQSDISLAQVTLEKVADTANRDGSDLVTEAESLCPDRISKSKVAADDIAVSTTDADNTVIVEEDNKNTEVSFAALRRLSSYCASPLTNIAILSRSGGGVLRWLQTCALGTPASASGSHLCCVEP